MDRSTIKKGAFSLLSAVICSYSCCSLFTDFSIFGALTFPLTLIFLYLFKKLRETSDPLRTGAEIPKSYSVILPIVSVLFGFCISVSGGVEKFFGGMNGLGLLRAAVQVCGISYLSFVFFRAVTLSAFGKSFCDGKFRIKPVFLFLITFICFIFYYLCLFPGMLNPDNFAQLYQCEDLSTLSNHHPVLHTMLLYLFVIRLGHGSPVLYFLFQIAVISLIFTYALNKLQILTGSKLFVLACILFYAVFPLNGYGASSMTKDYLFGAFCLLYAVCLSDILLSKGEALKKPSSLILFIVGALGTLFLRNNGFMIVLLSGIPAIFMLRRCRVRFISAVSATVLIFALAVAVIYPALGIIKSETVESLGVPIQQMMYTVKEDGNISPEDSEYLQSIIPKETVKEEYDPYTVDPIKFSDDFNGEVISNDIPRFFVTWLRLLIHNPSEYFISYFRLSEMLWDPFVECGMLESHTVSPHFTKSQPRPLIPILPGIIQSVVDVWQFSDLSAVFHFVWNPAVYLFASFLLFAVCLLKKRGRLWPLFMVSWSIWISLMLAIPAALAGRYTYGVILCLPLYAALTFKTEERETENG
ncbi:MAG: DUF6020 family protein [Clostridiales bacterium]|nr:DUF6020 family protein [Clostridiales bacterium]